MEAGKRVGDALQRTYAETIWKLNPLTKKIAPTKNEKISLDNSIQEQLEIFKEYNPVDDKDSDKKIKYLEEVPEIVRNANLGLTELGVASSSVTCERQISIPNDNQDNDGFFYHVTSPLLPVVGRIDFDFSNPNEFGANPTEHFSTPFVGSAFPHKIIELKTKYSRLGKVKKDGRGVFLFPLYQQHLALITWSNVQFMLHTMDLKFQFICCTQQQLVIKFLIVNNCKHLTVEGMQKNLQIMYRTFLRREKILSQFQDLTREEIIENAIGNDRS